MGQHAKVVSRKQISAAGILLDGPVLAGALLLYKVIAPAAGLGALAPVAAAPGKRGAEQAAAAVSNAHGAVDKGFQLQALGQGIAQRGDALQAELARKDDALGAQRPVKVQGGGRVENVGLGADVNVQPRRRLPHGQRRAHVGHNGGVYAGVLRKPRAAGQPGQVVVRGQDVERHIEAHAMRVRKGDGLGQAVGVKVGCGLAQPVTGHAAVHGVRAKAHRRLQLLPSARRGQKLHATSPAVRRRLAKAGCKSPRRARALPTCG